MTSASVVGKFMSETSGRVCTIMKFAPTRMSEGRIIYITDGLEYVDPLDNTSTFVTETGELLLAEQ